MKPEEMQELREFVDNLAKGRTENKDCTILTGKKRNRSPCGYFE